MHALKLLQAFQVIRLGLGRRMFRAVLLFLLVAGMQACARNHPNAFANPPALQPQCSIEMQQSGPRTRAFQGSAAHFKRRAKLSYIWSISDDPSAKIAGREFTITFESAVPRRAATVHLIVNGSDGTQAACDTVIW